MVMPSSIDQAGAISTVTPTWLTATEETLFTDFLSSARRLGRKGRVAGYHLAVSVEHFRLSLPVASPNGRESNVGLRLCWTPHPTALSLDEPNHVMGLGDRTADGDKG